VVVLLATLLLLQTCPRIRRGRLDCQEIPMYYADMMESKSTESKDGDFRPCIQSCSANPTKPPVYV
jgi:hypothetical protein